MIPQSTFLFSGVLAVLASAGAIPSRLFDAGTRLILAALATVWWGVYAFGAYDLGVAAGDGTMLTFSLMSHVIVGAVSGLVMLLFALNSVSEML